MFDAGGSYWDDQLHYYPLIVDGTVYTSIAREGERGGLVAIDTETGEFETIIQTEEHLRKPTIIDGDQLIVITVAIYRYDRTQSCGRPGTDRQ